MNFVAVAIVPVIVLGHPFNKKSRLLIGLNRILLYLNNNSQITKEFLGSGCYWFLFNNYKLTYQAVRFVNRFLIYETVSVHDNFYFDLIILNFYTVSQVQYMYSVCVVIA